MSEYAVYPSLRDKVAFVSGGASGIGAEFVSSLAAQGARVGFVDLDEDAARALVAKTDPEPLFIPADVRDIDELQAAIRQVGDSLGPVGILVNNAARDDRHASAEVDVAYWDNALAVNLRHHFFAIQAVVPQMRQLGGGSIINMGSISAHLDFTGMPAYITAKAGVEGLTRTMARELGADRIRVNCIIPGWVMTERQLTLWATPESLAQLEKDQALPGRVMPADIARMMLWLAADDSALCTGQQWVVDGGWM